MTNPSKKLAAHHHQVSSRASSNSSNSSRGNAAFWQVHRSDSIDIFQPVLTGLPGSEHRD